MRSPLWLRLARSRGTIRHLRRMMGYKEDIIREMERSNRELRRQIADLRLQLEQEKGWRYDMPAGKAAAQMEALRESGEMELDPFHRGRLAISRSGAVR